MASAWFQRLRISFVGTVHSPGGIVQVPFSRRVEGRPGIFHDISLPTLMRIPARSKTTALKKTVRWRWVARRRERKKRAEIQIDRGKGSEVGGGGGNVPWPTYCPMHWCRVAAVNRTVLFSGNTRSTWCQVAVHAWNVRIQMLSSSVHEGSMSVPLR